MVAGIKFFLAALLPVAFACNGYTGGVPKATSTKTNSKVITVKAGTTYDGKWARYDRGAGACGGQSEGGMCCLFALPLVSSDLLSSERFPLTPVSSYLDDT